MKDDTTWPSTGPATTLPEYTPQSCPILAQTKQHPTAAHSRVRILSHRSVDALCLLLQPATVECHGDIDALGDRVSRAVQHPLRCTQLLKLTIVCHDN